MPELLVGGALLFVLGLVMLLCPQWVWKAEHLFTVQGRQPTEFSLTATRVGGFELSFLGFWLLVFFVLTLPALSSGLPIRRSVDYERGPGQNN